jgi:hypothetical protein
MSMPRKPLRHRRVVEPVTLHRAVHGQAFAQARLVVLRTVARCGVHKPRAVFERHVVRAHTVKTFDRSAPASDAAPCFWFRSTNGWLVAQPKQLLARRCRDDLPALCLGRLAHAINCFGRENRHVAVDPRQCVLKLGVDRDRQVRGSVHGVVVQIMKHGR